MIFFLCANLFLYNVHYYQKKAETGRNLSLRKHAFLLALQRPHRWRARRYGCFRRLKKPLREVFPERREDKMWNLYLNVTAGHSRSLLKHLSVYSCNNICAIFCRRKSHLVRIFSRATLNAGKTVNEILVRAAVRLLFHSSPKRTPQTKTNITEKTDGFTDGTRSSRRWDFEEFKGFILFNSISTVVFYRHPKMEVWGEVASIKWS